MPYSIPGVGEGIGAIGIAMNVAGSATDFFGFVLAGGLKGEGAGVTDIHLIRQRLILDLTGIQFGKSTITSYQQRGMNTDKHDFSYLQFNNYGFAGGRLTATFLDRRFEVYGGGYKIGSELDMIMDQNKNTILEIQDPQTWRTNVYGLGVRGDLTDDYYDPRRGVRLDVSRWWSPPASTNDPDFFRIEYNAAAYFPLGKHSTWVFNYFRSDAHVVRKGETNPDAIKIQQGLNCSAITDPIQQADCNKKVDNVVDNIIAANTYGTATGLGGTSHLRSYPDNRYSGAHTVFYGTEIRWTLTEEARPFDIFLAKDVRTVLQAAAFYEMGSVADVRADLGDTYRASYGAGFRMVTASGIVLRADVATGREGIETTIILGYPWESF
jgi:outer membrane protein assembly factor BamA